MSRLNSSREESFEIDSGIQRVLSLEISSFFKLQKSLKDSSVKIKNLLDNIKDRETKKNIERVYDLFNSSPVKSHPNLIEIEERILTTIKELEHTVTTEDTEGIISTANSLQVLIKERNSLLRSLH